jgi:anti-sigma regulatory factor (Ser/Thr protein kinase)
MPLGLMPGMTYEENEAVVGGAATLLLHSDGLAEAHDPSGDMFGFPRLARLIEEHPGGPTLIDELLAELDRFTGEGWEQEDDVTLVLLHHAAVSTGRAEPTKRSDQSPADEVRTLAEFDVPSERGNERMVMERVADAVLALDLPPARLERLKTAVAEATMNAMEHGNGYRSEVPVSIKVLASHAALSVRITDRGGGRPIPQAEVPDLDAKLAGEQSPRGWGLFLIKNMVDDVHVTSDDTHHTVELVVDLEESRT